VQSNFVKVVIMPFVVIVEDKPCSFSQKLLFPSRILKFHILLWDVSEDFYWAVNLENKAIFALTDNIFSECT